MTKRKPLQWIEIDGEDTIWPDCYDCSEFLMRPGMTEAIASVGIEHGGIDIRSMLDRYHANRHRGDS